MPVNNRMFPSDPTGSLDDFIFLNSYENYITLGGDYARHISFY
jgi:hypothetical protein